MELAASYQGPEQKQHDVIYIPLPAVRKHGAYHAVKRGFDFVVSLVGLIVLLIPMVVIAICIVLDSPGGPIFKQERLGKTLHRRKCIDEGCVHDPELYRHRQ